MKNILIGLAGVLLLIFIGFFIGAKRSGEVVKENEVNVSGVVTPSTTPTPIKKTTSSSAAKASTSLVTNLFPQIGSYECRYDQASQTGRSTDTLYISGGKIRNEFRSLDSQGFGTLNMVVYDGKYLYSWIEGQSKGTVSEPKTLSDIPVVVPTDIHEGMVLGSGINNVSWDCHAWAPVSSMLSKPSYVNF